MTLQGTKTCSVALCIIKLHILSHRIALRIGACVRKHPSECLEKIAGRAVVDQQDRRIAAIARPSGTPKVEMKAPQNTFVDWPFAKR